MKRLLLVAFAVAVTTAWAAPAVSSAAEVTFNGEYRLRWEYRNNADFNDESRNLPRPNAGTNNSTANDHVDMYDQRVRLTANAKATDDTTLKFTIQDSRRWGMANGAGTTTAAGGGPQLTDSSSGTNNNATTGANSANNSLDMHESYVNIANLFGSPASIRVGRQELNYGDQRLVGAFGWNNSGRSFDAIKLMVNTDKANVDFFTSKIKDNLITNTDQDFHGIYATVKAVPNNAVDLYVLALRDRSQTTGTIATNSSNAFSGNATSGGTLTNTSYLPGAVLNDTQRIYTYGFRLAGKAEMGGKGGIDYTFELPIQRGTVHTRVPAASPGTPVEDYTYDIKAYAYAAKAGVTIPASVKMRIGAEYDVASGDDTPNADAFHPDSKIRTFFNMFPTNHDKLGYMDQQSWRNVKAWNVNFKIEPSDKVELYASYWRFHLFSKNDGWYGAGDWNVAPGTGTGATAIHQLPTAASKSSGNRSDDIGKEVDVTLKYKYNSAVALELGASHFYAGEFIKQRVNAPGSNGVTAGQDWAYVQLTANF